MLDSVGGSAIDGATITVTDSNNNSVNLGTTNTTGSDGTLSLTNYLTLGSTYNITATVSTSYAASEMVNYVAAAGATVALYCHKLGITGVADTAPTINYIGASVIHV